MKIERKFTTEATGAYGAMAFAITTSEIRNPRAVSLASIALFIGGVLTSATKQWEST